MQTKGGAITVFSMDFFFKKTHLPFLVRTKTHNDVACGHQSESKCFR